MKKPIFSSKQMLIYECLGFNFKFGSRRVKSMDSRSWKDNANSQIFIDPTYHRRSGGSCMSWSSKLVKNPTVKKKTEQREISGKWERTNWFCVFFFLVDVVFFNINNFFFNLSSHISLKCASSAPSLTCKHFPLVSWWNGPNWLQVENWRNK